MIETHDSQSINYQTTKILTRTDIINITNVYWRSPLDFSITSQFRIGIGYTSIQYRSKISPRGGGGRGGEGFAPWPTDLKEKNPSIHHPHPLLKLHVHFYSWVAEIVCGFLTLS